MKRDHKVICAWCKTVLGDGVGPVSHGICTKCLKRALCEAQGEEGDNDTTNEEE